MSLDGNFVVVSEEARLYAEISADFALNLCHYLLLACSFSICNTESLSVISYLLKHFVFSLGSFLITWEVTLGLGE